jgi:3-hydroxyacyl-[acyl-carrier-protein] dehydratase
VIEKHGGKVIGFTELKEKYLQHRYPLLMLDRVTDYKPGEYIEAIKCVTGNSPELVGHFPERAIMPATSIVQAFAQLAIVFFKLSLGGLRHEDMTLVSSVKFRFLAPVFPGDTLELTMKPRKLEGSVGIFTADARVNGKSVVKGALTLASTAVARFEDAPW